MYLPSNLIFQSFARNYGNFITQPFVGVEIQSQSHVILFNDDFGTFFDSFGSDTTL